MPNYQWMPKPNERILGPFLATASPDVVSIATEALEAIRQDPYDPPFPRLPYKGHDVANAHIAIAGNGRLWICYQIYRDYPLLALRNILEMWSSQTR
jgi:hypothetical protein